MILPLAVAAATTIAVTLAVTGVGFAAGAIIDVFHVAPISFKAVGAVVAFVAHIWRSA